MKASVNGLCSSVKISLLWLYVREAVHDIDRADSRALATILATGPTGNNRNNITELQERNERVKCYWECHSFEIQKRQCECHKGRQRKD